MAVWGHHILLTALLLLFFISPVLQKTPKAKLVFDFLFWSLIGSLALLNWKNHAARVITSFLVLAALGSSLLMFFLSGWHILFIHAVISFMALCMVFAALIMSMMHARSASWDTVSGAVCAYLAMAATWANAFILVEMLHPNSFIIPVSLPQANTYAHLINKMFYFSIITISTVGYGDILPCTDLTRMLVAFEAIMGQFFIAVTLARVVSLHLHSLHSKD